MLEESYALVYLNRICVERDNKKYMININNVRTHQEQVCTTASEKNGLAGKKIGWKKSGKQIPEHWGDRSEVFMTTWGEGILQQN